MNLSEKNDTAAPSEFKENLNILRDTYFFSGFPLETLKVFAYLCTREKFKPGEYLFRQGEEDDRAFYVIEGRLGLEYSKNGEAATIREFRAGEFIGSLTLLGEMGRLFSLRAMEETSCLVLNREKFTKALEQFPEVMPKIFKAVTHAIGHWEDRFLADRTDRCSACMSQLGVSLL